MRFPRANIVLLFLVLAALIVPPAAMALTSSEVEGELMCDCGCGDVLVNCTCDRSEELRAIINGMIQSGKTKEEILQIFVDQFGEVILSAPPRRGFNLVAYGAPAAGLLIGTALAVVVVRRWSAAGRREEDEEASPDEAVSESLPEDVERKIDEELGRIEED
ncbi:MAG: cytochrome c-type biogenesis protein CcmH [bacterium]|nr:MAG: cytochrome c-type biogenesis protein CcmH [bacterium]